MTIEDEPFIRETNNNGEKLESPQVLQPVSLVIIGLSESCLEVELNFER